MRTIINVFSGVILLAGVSFLGGCEKIESMADVKFDATMDGDIGVVIPVNSKKSVSTEGFEFSESVTIDPQDNPDIEKYFDKLKSFDVQEVTGTVKKVMNGPVSISSGQLTISSGDQSVSWDIPLLQLQEGTSLTFGNDNGEWDKVNGILDAKQKFTATLSGVSDKDGVSFTVNIAIKVKVTANPLK